jgi:hypothetical protein
VKTHISSNLDKEIFYKEFHEISKIHLIILSFMHTFGVYDSKFDKKRKRTRIE